ncbi:unnamed protein product [Parajaminaea phylloscopi]
MLEGYNSDDVARFILARVTDPEILAVSNYEEATALMARRPDLEGSLANVEGTYLIWTRYTDDNGRKETGSYTGLAADQVVGARTLVHHDRFAELNGKQSGLYRLGTTARLHALVTVAPNVYPGELMDLWRECTGRRSPSELREEALRAVCALDELVLAVFCGDIWSAPINRMDLRLRGLTIVRCFNGLNASLPSICNLYDAAKSKKRRLDELQRTSNAAEDHDERCKVAREVVRGKSVAEIEGNWVKLSLAMYHDVEIPSGLFTDGPARFWVKGARKNSLLPPQCAPPAVNALLDSFELFLEQGGQTHPLTFLAASLTDGNWGGALEDLAECMATYSRPRTPLLVQAHTARPALDETALRLLHPVGSAFECFDYKGKAALDLPGMPLKHRQWFAALEQGETVPKRRWVLPEALGAKAGDVVVLKVDRAQRPYLLRLRVRGQVPTHLVTNRDPHALIFVNLARYVLGLPRRGAVDSMGLPLQAPEADWQQWLQGLEDDDVANEDSDDGSSEFDDGMVGSTGVSGVSVGVITVQHRALSLSLLQPRR